MTRALLITLTACATSLSASAYGNDLGAEIDGAFEASLKSLFRHFHANPELSFREFKTSEKLSSELDTLGFDVTREIGQTGIVAVMKNGPGPVLMIRADMDGLPVKEDTDIPYASTAMQTDIDGIKKPVMHACGHDVHMTALVGTAQQLVRLRDQWSGTLMLIGQPAEERISGARAMLDDGLYTRFPVPEYALAFHVSASVPAGRLAVSEGSPYSSADSVDIYVKGVGAHGASPHQGVDPILLAANIVSGLQHVVSRTLSPREPGVITVGALVGGTKHNIIGDSAHLKLTVRSDSLETRNKLISGIRRVARGEAIAMGVPETLMPEVVPSPTETTPAVVNHTDTTRRLRSTFDTHFGSDIFWDTPRQGMGAEDFSYFISAPYNVKGVYFGVGGTPESELETAASHHSPFFKVDAESSVKTATEAMVVATLDLLGK